MPMGDLILAEQYGAILQFYYVWIPVTTDYNYLRDYCNAFWLWTPAVFCELQNFTQPSTAIRVSR